MHQLTGQECTYSSIQDITVHGLHVSTKTTCYADVLGCFSLCLHINVQNLICFKTNLFSKNQIFKMREIF